MKKAKVDFERGKAIAHASAMFRDFGSVRLFAVGTQWLFFGDLKSEDVPNLVAILYYPDGGIDYLNDYQRGVIGRDIERRQNGDY